MEGRDLRDFFAMLHEVETVSSDLPGHTFTVRGTSLGGLLLVLSDEGHELSLVIDHEHFLHITQAKAIV